MKNIILKYISVCILIFLLFITITPHAGHPYDTWCWNQWASYIFTNGLGNVYNSSTDYLPLYHYILYFFGLLQGSIEKISRNIYQLKLITLFFHFITGFYLALIIKRNNNWESFILNTLFYLLNIAVLYNTVIWGQVDEILSCFIFLSCFYAYKKKVLPSLIFLILAINFKLQAIIFIPAILLMLLPVIISAFSIKKITMCLLFPFMTQLLILMPFILTGTLESLWNTVTGGFGKYPVVSMNAYNIWEFLLKGDLMTMQDNNTFLNITYKSWGLVMFFTTSGFALLPLIKNLYMTVIKKAQYNVPLEKYLIICAIIPFLFFYFNTQMHERYAHPALVFLIAYSLYTKKPIMAIIGCLAYFLNLEGVLKFMNLNNYRTLIFNHNFISALYLLTIILLYIELFNLNFIKLQNKIK